MVAAEEAAKLLAGEKLELVDFTSHIDCSTHPGHYVIFWELSSDAGEEVLSSCCNCLDLAFVDGGYVTSRRAGGIGPLELRIVGKGTFRKILEHSISLGTAINQFKTPRFVGPSHGKVLQILCDNVIKSYFSTAYGC
ncbi:putative Jasmonic acid-amido synthetase JAR1 [Cocos nucifera]|nr:putative Jasmonic acid-amido synthetase JAR1 [Cocos nucifera]